MRNQFSMTAAGILGAFLVMAAASLVEPERADACPFCSAVSQTFSEEIDSMDAVVFARLIEPPPPIKAGESDDNEVPRAKFSIEQIVKGEKLVGDEKVIDTIYFGDAKKGEQFLVMGVDPPNLMWSTPLQVSERTRQYITKLPSLPAEGAERLLFFQDYLEDEDELMARDAYDEFARAPYDSVKGLKKEMDREQLLAWINDPKVPASRRRLYLTMLGVCGGESDLSMLESMLKSDDRQMKSGLDALIGCYLTLKGADGLPLIEDLYLKNAKAEYADTYAAIMALRFHGTDGGVIPRERVVQSLHFMLERPQLADLVIPDLARWEDWSQVDRLVRLFKESDDKTSWVRVPVINYLRACPQPEAKEHLIELEKIDPASVKRANTFFPFTTPSSTDKPKETPKTSSVRGGIDTTLAAIETNEQPTRANADPSSGEPPAQDSTPDAVASRAAETNSDASHADARTSQESAVAAAGPTNAATQRLSSPTLASTPDVKAPNRIVVLGVAWVTCVILMLVQWTLLSGARPATAPAKR